MAAPEYVPRNPIEKTRAYHSPLHVPDHWKGGRPSDIRVEHPMGDLYGWQGPDQGYALKLARRFDDRLHLQEGERRADVDIGCVEVALKRASIVKRAPVVHDLEVAYRVWGLLDPTPPDELVTLRRRLFEGVASSHHYFELRGIVDRVPDSTLRMTPALVEDAYRTDWRSLLEL